MSRVYVYQCMHNRNSVKKLTKKPKSGGDTMKVISPALSEAGLIYLHNLWHNVVIAIQSDATNLSGVGNQSVFTHTSAHETPMCLCVLRHPTRFLVATSAQTIWAVPDNVVNLGVVLMDCPEPIACATHTAVGQKLSLQQELDGVFCGGCQPSLCGKVNSLRDEMQSDKHQPCRSRAGKKYEVAVMQEVQGGGGDVVSVTVEPKLIEASLDTQEIHGK